MLNKMEKVIVEPLEADIMSFRLFRVPKFALKFLGFWPETTLSTLGAIHRIFNISILISAVSSEMGYGFLNIKTPITALDAIAPALSKVLTILKLSMLFLHRRKFRNVIKKALSLLKPEANEHKLKILKRMKLMNSIFGSIVFALGNATNAAYFLRPLVNNAYNLIKGRTYSKDLPFTAAIPFSLEPVENFVFAYSVIAYSGFVTAFGFGGVDGFFVEFSFYISTLFQLVQEDIKMIFPPVIDEKISPEGNQRARKCLSEIIEKHTVIMDLCEEIVDLFTVIILGHFLTAAIVICISSIDFMMGTGFNIVLYVIHSVAVSTELLVYCMGGSNILESSTGIAETIYFSEWYKYDIKTQRMLLFIMVRAQKGTGVAVPFFSPSIPVFGTMMRTAGSYITLLKTFL